MPIDLTPWGLGGPPKPGESFYRNEVNFDSDSDSEE